MLERTLAQRTQEFLQSEHTRLEDIQKNAQFGAIAKGLFHDLMNPLSSISLTIENAASRTTLSPEIKPMIEKVLIISRKMNSYMNSIKRTIRTDTDTITLTNIAQEIRLVFDLLGYKARISGITLISHIAEDISISIQSIRIHQVILNLVTNAIEACEKATTSGRDDTQNDTQNTVTVSLSKHDTEIILNVVDTGCGIPSTHLARIYNGPFTSKPHGTGIGLRTVRDIIEKELRGRIDIDSIVGRGTTVTVTLPQHSS